VGGSTRSRVEQVTHASGEPTEDLPLPDRLARAVAPDPGEKRSLVRLFSTTTYFRLWLAQVASSLGDWVGFVAITALANRIGGTNGVGFALAARMIPGFFFGSVAGVLIDRLDRKKVMVICDIGRGLVIGLLPFVHSILELILASLVLEILTLLWSSAKEATVPNLVNEEDLPRVNSLSLGAAYGTFPVGAALFTALASIAVALSRFKPLQALEVSQENLAIWLDTVTFLISALIISRIAIPRREAKTSENGRRIDLGEHVRELREGWRFIGRNRVVGGVMLALGAGLFGGGMVVPLGPVFAEHVLGGGPRAFGALITALGVGMAAGVIGVSVMQSRLNPRRAFSMSVLFAGAALVAAASMFALTPALLIVAGLGICAGTVYVLGFSLIQANTEDDLRGRTFVALYTVVRFTLLLAFAVGPFLAGALDRLSNAVFDGEVGIGSWVVQLHGTRLALWLAGVMVIGAGLIARRRLRRR
jgi:dTMP kinase